MMRPLSPSPLNCGTRQRLLAADGAFADEESSARSSSLPPRGRVAFSGVNTLAPCSREFQKSLNDLTRRDDDNASPSNKLTLPVIQVLRNSETNNVSRDGSHGKNCWDDDSTTSGNSTSDDDIYKSWTSLSGVGTLFTLQPKGHSIGRTKNDNSDGEMYDDSMSVRSDSYVMCRTSPSVRRKQKGEKKVESTAAESDTLRLSRKDGGTQGRKTNSGLKIPRSSTRQRGLSPLSRPQLENDQSFRPPIHRSKSAHASPQQERRDTPIIANGTNSAPTSPYGSPLLNRASNAKRPIEIPKWQKPFNLSTSPPSSSFISQNINPILTKPNTSSATGKNQPSYNHRGARIHKDASRLYRLSDLSPERVLPKPSHTVVNLEEEFKRLRACRYLRGNSDDKESEEYIN